MSRIRTLALYSDAGNRIQLTRLFLVFGLALLLVLGAGPQASAQDATVQIAEHPTLGNILTDAKGMTLYLFTKDAKNVTNCYDQCAVNWPPLLANSGSPVAGPGLTGSLGTIDRTDGTKQVTYNGIPLYFWIKDVRPWDATGQGVGGVWFVLYPETTEIAAPAPAAAAPSSQGGTPAAAATPSTLPVTGGAPLPWLPMLALGAGGVLLLGGLGLAVARRTR